jgi:hypothetical protein
MRVTSLVLLALLVLCVPLVLARHHSTEQQNAAFDSRSPFSWAESSAHHHSNSPIMMSYRPDEDDKKDKDHDKGDDDDDWMKEPSGTRAALCRQYDCPNFNSTCYPTFTRRSYNNITAACTTIRSFAPWKFGEAEAFKRLYEYFGGENAGNTKINMTVPVVRYVKPGTGDLNDGSHPNVSICFFLPTKFSYYPPTPNNKDVHLYPTSFDVLVHPFEGWSTHENVGKALAQFQLILHLAGVDFNKERYVHAAYTEPWILWPRYNEIWLMTGSDNDLFPSQPTPTSHPTPSLHFPAHHGHHGGRDTRYGDHSVRVPLP